MGYRLIEIVRRRKKRSKYEDIAYRKAVADNVIKKRNKEPSRLSVYDFQLENSGLLQWYVRKYKCKYGKARDILLKELYNTEHSVNIKPKGYWSNMSNEELLDYCYAHYGEDICRSELEKKDKGLYMAFIRKKLTNKLKSKKRPSGFLKEASNEELLKHCFELYGKNITRGKIRKDSGLYCELRKRGLIEKIKLASNRKPHGYMGKWNNFEGEMNKAIEENNFEFPSWGRLQEMGYGNLCTAITRYYSNINEVRKKMGYNITRKSKNHWKDWDNIEIALNKVMRNNGGEFPSEEDLKQARLSSLYASIVRYHDGIDAVREKIGYNEKMRVKLARELEEIVKRADI